MRFPFLSWLRQRILANCSSDPPSGGPSPSCVRRPDIKYYWEVFFRGPKAASQPQARGKGLSPLLTTGKGTYKLLQLEIGHFSGPSDPASDRVLTKLKKLTLSKRTDRQIVEVSGSQ